MSSWETSFSNSTDSNSFREADLTSATNPAVVTFIHLLLAAGVTAHALVHKRDAGSAMAWIGLAWLAPILGSVLYLLLGINRVRRRAMSLRSNRLAVRVVEQARAGPRDDHLAPLACAGLSITQRPLESGNAITILRNGDEAYPRMIAAIEAARRSVALSSYIFRADVAGIKFIDALSGAMKRGLDVRVLIDGFGGGYFRSATYRRLRRAGVPVARFLHSPLPWRMPFLNLRTHKKVLGVDGRIAFTGGLNIGAENLTRRQPRRPVFDTHFLFEGPVVAQLIDVFADDWFFATGQQLAGDGWFPPMESAGDSVARAVTSGPDQDIEKIELMILEAIACARTSVKIMTPYFLPDERIITALALASLRGVEVDVVLPERSNHPAVDWATRVQIGPLLAAGCRVWTHPPPFDHSKLMTVDGLWCLIGSANWDIRSFRLNFELDLEVYHAGLVQQVNRRIVDRQETRITADALAKRSLPVLLRDSAARLMLPYL
ncbi:Phospholipase D/Transphosphatidylase [Burkholderiales bacterium]|jgi:cardiolipin synthase|nr:Phospholipase D/Transphosphatidylase [Burkholderiales bacterium]